MKRLKKFISDWLSNRNLKRLKKEALRLHKMTKKQYFVIPVNDWKRGEFVIVNNEAHKLYNQQAKKLGKPVINFVELCKMAVYKTPSGNLLT
jgi:hypothetical protein